MKKSVLKKAHPKQGEFATAQEAAQAKTDDLMKSLEKTDLSFFEKKE